MSMVDLMSVEERGYSHTIPVAPAPDDDVFSAPPPQVVFIDNTKFQELYKTIPPDEKLNGVFRSFRISRDNTSVRVSFFEQLKHTEYRDEKQRMNSTMAIDRYIIKLRGKSFYISKTKGENRKRRRKLVQNVLRADDALSLMSQFINLLQRKMYPDETWTYSNKEIPDEMMAEIVRFQKILLNELDITDTFWSIFPYPPFEPPRGNSDVIEYMGKFFMYALLHWYCKRNNVIMRENWLYPLMGHQYFTLYELKKHGNDYWAALCDFYSLPDDIEPLMEVAFPIITAPLIQLTTVSVWRSMFDTRTIVDSNLMSHNVNLNDVFNMANPKDRAAFRQFLAYLSANKEYWRKWFEAKRIIQLHDNSYYLSEVNVGEFIVAIAKLWRLSIHFDFNQLLEIYDDTPHQMYASRKVNEFINEIDKLLSDTNSFTRMVYNPKYKSRVEEKFQMFGEKWQLKLHFNRINPTITKFTEFDAILENLTTQHMLRLTVTYPNYRQKMALVTDFSDLLAYARRDGKSRLHIDTEKLGYVNNETEDKKGKELIRFFTHIGGVPMPHRRKLPEDDSSFVHVLRKVYKKFYRYARFFSVDYKVLVPILEYHLKDLPMLNKYTHINS